MKRNSYAESSFVKLLQSILLSVPTIHLAAITDDGVLPDEQLVAGVSGVEQLRANQIAQPDERRHFLFRRCFQRVFVAHVTGWQGDLCDLDLRHGLDQRPQCVVAPDLCLSFSSTGQSFIFGAAEKADLGVDIERVRSIENVMGLAERFFSAGEAHAVNSAHPHDRDRLFLTLWSAKEAGLKAKGLGIVSGLNRFEFENQVGRWHIRDRDAPETQGHWQLLLPHWRAGHIVAVMHRPAD